MNSLDQVFLYVTVDCNIGCMTCYMRECHQEPSLMPLSVGIEHLKEFRARGAWKLSILGGEPTLYPYLGDLVFAAKKIGYTYVRINTNGQFDQDLLMEPGIKQLDTICFSIDGPTEKINSEIRRGSNLGLLLNNMRAAKRLGYDVRVNCTVTARNLGHVPGVISVAEQNGCSLIYINIVFMMGAALENSFLAIQPEEWLSMYKTIVETHHNWRTRIRVPIGYVSTEQSKAQSNNNHQCLAARGSRVYVLPNGDTYPCLLLLSEPSLKSNGGEQGDYVMKLQHFAGVDEAELHTHCHFINTTPSSYLPLCIYFKEKLNYDFDV